MPFSIIRNDITKVAADMIVNTANPQTAIGSGVDSAIYEAAGCELLLEARKKIGVLTAGEAAVTPAYGLPAKYIAHCCGPVWKDGQAGEIEILESCYEKCLNLAAEYKCRSIAFPLLSTGRYGFPKEVGMQTAISVFSRFLTKHEMEIILVVFGSSAYRISGQFFENVRSYVDDKYVEKAAEREYSRFNAVQIDNSSVCGCFPGANYDMLAPKAGPAPKRKSGVKEKLSESLDDMLKKMYTDSFEKHLKQLINRKGLKNSEVYTAANISKQYFSKLLKGQIKPSKEKVMSLAIGLHLNMDEAVDFMRIAGYALSPVSQTDVIVEFFIRNEEYSVMKIDYVLFDYGLPLLSEK